MATFSKSFGPIDLSVQLTDQRTPEQIALFLEAVQPLAYDAQVNPYSPAWVKIRTTSDSDHLAGEVKELLRKASLRYGRFEVQRTAVLKVQFAHNELSFVGSHTRFAGALRRRLQRLDGRAYVAVALDRHGEKLEVSWYGDPTSPIFEDLQGTVCGIIPNL
jgi:hypothetical protein